MWLCAALLSVPALAFDHFITRKGPTLYDGKKEFRFAGIHAPELHRIEDDAKGKCAADPRGWGQYFKWPTPAEQENWIQSLVFTGHKAMRVYVLSIENEFDKACGRETHILKPATPGGMPQINEAAMVHYDRMIALADQYKLRLILPFIDHWEWWGGRAQLAAFYGETDSQFYDVNSKTFKAYLYIIEQIINRKNTITGRYYRDEKAIMMWETGNELRDTTEPFLKATAAKIRSLDKNHLIMDGTYRSINSFALTDPNIDIISNHFYENVGNNNPEQVVKDLTAVGGKKVYIVGEYGLLPIAKMQAIMDAAVNTEIKGAKTAGVFVWGMRGHREAGGFYWHKESDNYYSYHLPGFPEGAANEEIPVVNMVRQAQAAMAGKKVPDPLPKPLAPKLHPISDPKARIQWMGAAVGRTYDIERASQPQGPWVVVGKDISDGHNLYDPEKTPLFKDPNPGPSGSKVYYRVLAKNESGVSPPSNVEAVTLP
jgi:hypothetical protein